MASLLKARIERAGSLMKSYGLDTIILTKPANTVLPPGRRQVECVCHGDPRWKGGVGSASNRHSGCKSAGHLDHIIGFEDEVGMIHSIAHFFKEFGISQGNVGLEYAFLPQPRMGMLIHPHAKPEAVKPTDCTPLMTELRLVKDAGEIE